MADSHGWSLDGISVSELMPSEDALEPDEQYTVFHPSEVELSETTRRILDEVERVKPTRIVFDSLSELRLLAGGALRYRRQILAFKQFFAGRHCTVLLLDDLTSTEHDLQVQSIAHGALLLEQLVPRLRRGASAAQRDRSSAGSRVSRRLPRLRHPSRRASGLSAPGGCRVPAALESRTYREAVSRRSTRCWAAASSAARAR